MIINGTQYSNSVSEILKEDILSIIAKTGLRPTLKVIIVGEDPASIIYVTNKKKKAIACGIDAETIFLDKYTSESKLLELIKTMNEDIRINGILVQSPVPTHISMSKIVEAISIYKDVDCFHPYNVGKFFLNNSIFHPCTPMACMYLIKTVEKNIEGMEAVVIGESNIVGKPVSQMLQQSKCTVTNIHLSTRNPEIKSRNADIIIVAVGKSGLITKEWVKNGAIVIDVGINRLPMQQQKPIGNQEIIQKKIVGDTDFEGIKGMCRAITPVPGGVGPMTISFLLVNTLKAFYIQNQLKFENSMIFKTLLQNI